MTGGPEAPEQPGETPGGSDPAAALRDWMTLVQTELAGLAADREALETWLAMGHAMGQAMGQAVAGMWARGPGAHDPARSPAGAAAAAAASAAGGDARVAALLERVDALERRVAELEQRGRRRKRGGAG